MENYIIIFGMYCISTFLSTGEALPQSLDTDSNKFQLIYPSIQSNEKLKNTIYEVKQFDGNQRKTTIHTISLAHTESFCTNANDHEISDYIDAFINGNTVTFEQQISTITIGIDVSPNYDLTNYKVIIDIGHFGEITYSFEKNKIICKDSNSILPNSNAVVEICVQARNIITSSKNSENNITACFTIAGAALTKEFYDINTITVQNGMFAFAADIGCFTANNSNVTHQNASLNQLTVESLKTTLTSITHPLHDKMCNSAYCIKSGYLLVFISVLKAIQNF